MSPTTVTTLCTSLVTAVACAALTGCSTGTGAGQGAAPDTDAPCPVTSPTAAEDHPDAVSRSGGSATWFGSDGLWVDLGNFGLDVAAQGDSFPVKHAWWSGDASGASTDRWGRPDVRAVRLDGEGEVRAGDEGGYARAGGFSWWPTVLDFPARGCWEITGELHGTTVRFVVEI